MKDFEESSRPLSLDFKGEGYEYFKIWCVNTLLTIITIGIYSAWATVRNNRYFYANLFLDDSSFQYLADPLTILKGRLIAVTCFVFYLLVSNFYPIVGVFLALMMFIAIPYLVIRSLAFGNRMTAWRGVQFRFNGRYKEAFMALYVWPLLGVISIGLLYPMTILKLNRFIAVNSAYGTTNFKFHATYKDYGKIFLLIFIGIIIIGLMSVVLSSYMVPEMMLVSLVFYGILFVYAKMAFINLFHNSLRLQNHYFLADLEFNGLFKIYVTNLFLIILSLGLYLPFAKVKLTKYIVDHINPHALGDIGEFASAEKEKVGALGEELGQVFDFDIGAY